MAIGGSDGTVHVLRQFLKDWKEALRGAEQRRLERSVPNAVVALHHELSTWIPSQTAAGRPAKIKDGNSRRGYVAHTLRALLTEADPGTALLEAMAPADVGILRTELARLEIDAGAIMPALSDLVKVVEEPGLPLAEALRRAITPIRRRLPKGGRFDSTVLMAAAELHVRALLRDHDPSDLEYWGERRLAAGALRVVTDSRLAEWTHDQALAARMTAATRHLCQTLRDTVDEVPLPDGHRRFPMSYGIVRYVRRALLEEDQAAAARRLALFLTRSVAARRIEWYTIPFLGEVVPQCRAVWQAVESIERPLAERLVADNAVVATSHGRPLGGMIGRGIRGAVVERLARAVAWRHHDSDPSFASAIERWLQSLRLAAPTSLLPEQWADVASTMRGAHAELQALVECARPAVEALMLESLRGGTRRKTAWWFDDAMWRLWRAETLTEARRDSSAWSDFRWDNLRGAQLQRALEPLGAPLGRPREFDVVLPVDGVHDLGSGFTAGGIAWYDPAVRDFGEGTDWSPQAREVHTHVRVRAPSPAIARSRALSVLEPALSTLVFALSSSQSVAGFRPTASRWTFVGDRASGAAGSSWRRGREEMADVASGAALQRYAEVYGEMVRSRPGRRSLATRAFLRAAFWYRSGRWQPDPVRRFLDHYVALEHLLAHPGRKKDEEVAQACALILSGWQDRGFVFARALDGVIESARRLSDAVTAAPPASPLVAAADAASSIARNGSDWRTSLRPWLSPQFVGAVAAAIPDDEDCSDWTAHQASLARLVDQEPLWKGYDSGRKNDVEFRVRLLARRRHEIVHEAMTSAPGIDLEARALTRIVEDVLRILAQSLLAEPRSTPDLPSWIAACQPPWL